MRSLLRVIGLSSLLLLGSSGNGPQRTLGHTTKGKEPLTIKTDSTNNKKINSDSTKLGTEEFANTLKNNTGTAVIAQTEKPPIKDQLQKGNWSLVNEEGYVAAANKIIDDAKDNKVYTQQKTGENGKVFNVQYRLLNVEGPMTALYEKAENSDGKKLILQKNGDAVLLDGEKAHLVENNNDVLLYLNGDKTVNTSTQNTTIAGGKTLEDYIGTVGNIKSNVFIGNGNNEWGLNKTPQEIFNGIVKDLNAEKIQSHSVKQGNYEVVWYKHGNGDGLRMETFKDVYGNDQVAMYFLSDNKGNGNSKPRVTTIVYNTVKGSNCNKLIKQADGFKGGNNLNYVVSYQSGPTASDNNSRMSPDIQLQTVNGQKHNNNGLVMQFRLSGTPTILNFGKLQNERVANKTGSETTLVEAD